MGGAECSQDRSLGDGVDKPDLNEAYDAEEEQPRLRRSGGVCGKARWC